MPLPFLKFFVSVDEKNGCRTSNNQIALNTELPRQGARHVLGGGRPPGGEGEGDPARGDVGMR